MNLFLYTRFFLHFVFFAQLFVPYIFSEQRIKVSSKPKADLVIFSYNRPMQLYALLESVERYMVGIGDTVVIYRASDERYAMAYEKVYERFSYVMPCAQGVNPNGDFKLLMQQAVFDSSKDYVLFAVDDIIVKDYVDLSECIETLEHENAYGFYLRLGKNTNFCYPLNKSQGVPPLRLITDDIFSWQFVHGIGDWGYPHTVDMTLFKKEVIMNDLKRLSYTAPNTFEAAWAGQARSIKNKFGLCYKQSKMVNLPLNVVQKIYKNRTTNSYYPEQLLDIFNAGHKIDINPLYKIKNRSAHMDYDLTFLERRDEGPYNIGLLIVATGTYIQCVDLLIASAEKYFCKKHNVTYFVFTDSNEPLPENVVRIYQEKLACPYDTNMYEKQAKLFIGMDFLFTCDADMLFVDTVGDEILFQHVATRNPAFLYKCGTCEVQKKSCVCIAKNKGKHYCAGSFNGGRTGEFLKFAHFVTRDVQKELQ
ncbi:hypothetical protein KC460_03315 [Candidatus Dependentiae bacterium]|nr:hypothetical protein [Candidatus Dependentiae bacterium]